MSRTEHETGQYASCCFKEERMCWLGGDYRPATAIARQTHIGVDREWCTKIGLLIVVYILHICSTKKIEASIPLTQCMSLTFAGLYLASTLPTCHHYIDDNNDYYQKFTIMSWKRVKYSSKKKKN